MATGVESRKTASAESSIERHLADTCRRIRLFDTGASLLLFGSLLWAHAIVFAVFDLSVDGADSGWPFAVRWIGYAIFLALAALLALQVVWRLVRPINPYYAARRLEETVPEAKNSVISWLDLKEQALPPALRRTIGSKAAHDLEEADPEHAVDRRPTWWRLGLFLALTLGMLVLIAARPGQFVSLMRRAFLPFYHGRLTERTHITLLRPEEGDAVVTEKQSLNFIAQINGRVPDVNQPGAPALYYRYQSGDRFVASPLQQDPNGHWTTRLSPDQIGSTGLWYKIAAGDAETPLYQVTVRAQPFVQGYEITYKYRPYLNRPTETIAFPNAQAALPFIKRHQGTEVALLVRTNRPVRHSSVRLVMGKTVKDLPGGVLKDDPQAFRTQWTLEKSGEFAVDFISADGERYWSRVPFPMDVLVDAAPTVALTRPAQNVTLPANGTLEVEGTADDDIGVKSVTLRLETVEDGKPVALQPLPYRGGASLDLDGKGMYPWHLDYLDLIKLDELRTFADEPLMLKPGAIVRYWLEAADNSDYPNKEGNVGKSPAYEIKILPPQDPEKQQQARAGSQEKKQKHDAQQKQKLGQEKQQRESANQGGDKQGNNSPEKQQADKLKEEIQKDLEKHNQPSPSDKGEAKGKDEDRSQNKPAEDGAGGAPQAEQKDQQPGNPNDAGNGKDGPQQGGANQQPGESKDAGPPNDTKGGNESGGAQGDPMAGTKKDGPGDGQSKGSDQGNGGAQGTPEPSGQSKGSDSQTPPQPAKTKGGDESGMQTPSAQSKPGGTNPKGQPDPTQPPQGLAKPEEATGPRSLSKEKGPDTAKQSFDPQLKNAAKNAPGEQVGSGKEAGKPPTGQSPTDAPGFAKGDEPASKETAQQPPTPQQVEQLKELMQRKDGIGDWAKNALEQMSKDAPDPSVRDLAKQALDQAGPKDAPSKGASGSPDPKAATNTKAPTDPAGAGNQANNTKTAKARDNTNPAKSGNPTKKPGGEQPGGITGQNPSPGGGPADTIKPDAVRNDLARFGGNLQLDDFLKRATPEYRAKHGISDADWQRLLANAAKYDDLLRKMQQPKGKTPRDGRSKGTTIGSVGPTQVQSLPGTVDPADSGRAEPPPELRDALERLRNLRK
jgi:hypothetical protein